MEKKCKYTETYDPVTESLHIVNEDGCDWENGVGCAPDHSLCGECNLVCAESCTRRTLIKQRLQKDQSQALYEDLYVLKTSEGEYIGTDGTDHICTYKWIGNADLFTLYSVAQEEKEQLGMTDARIVCVRCTYQELEEN